MVSVEYNYELDIISAWFNLSNLISLTVFQVRACCCNEPSSIALWVTKIGIIYSSQLALSIGTATFHRKLFIWASSHCTRLISWRGCHSNTNPFEWANVDYELSLAASWWALSHACIIQKSSWIPEMRDFTWRGNPKTSTNYV